MKILVVSQYYYPEQFRITDICETLVLRGHDVTVLTGLPNYPEGEILFEYRNKKNRYETINNVKVIRTWLIERKHNNFFLFLNYLSFAISASFKVFSMKEQFDLVFINQLSPIFMALPGIRYSKKKRVKNILYCLDLWPESLISGGVRRKSIIFKSISKISKKIYNSVDKILVTSSLFKTYLVDEMGVNFPDIDILPQYAEDVFIKNTRNHYKNYNNESYNFVFAGNIGEVQSVETIIEAAKILLSRVDIKFHIVGVGSKFEYCSNIIKNYNVSNITLHGKKPVNEMPYFYDLADAFIITLKRDKILSYTVPGKLQSYMAYGKPIIGSIDGEVANIIRSSKSGYVSEAENSVLLAENICRLIDEGDFKELGKNAKKFYEENFSKQSFFEKLENEFYSVGGNNV